MGEYDSPSSFITTATINSENELIVLVGYTIFALDLYNLELLRYMRVNAYELECANKLEYKENEYIIDVTYGGPIVLDKNFNRITDK